MDARERLLTAMDGSQPDRVPCALAFYHLDLQRLVPTGQAVDGLIDVQFVDLPLSPEEQRLRRLAQPYDGDTRLGTPAQVTTYARWHYRPQAPQQGNPLARAESLDDLRRFPFPDATFPYRARGLAGQVRTLHARGLAAGQRSVERQAQTISADHCRRMAQCPLQVLL